MFVPIKVVPNVPYALDEEWLARLFDKYQVSLTPFIKLVCVVGSMTSFLRN